MKRPLRVCHVSTMTGWGGVERMLVDLLTHVHQSEVHHHLLTTSSKPEILQEVWQANIPYFEPQRRWHYDLSAVFQMANWLKEKQIDVVHTYNAFANCWGYLAARLAKVPVFLAGEHGSVFTHHTSRFLV
ncbi:MAG: glycosyltransferase [Anaerolineae bacterium]|nr:glycosyltransferase [Anaerolineae bacterium]